MNKEMSRLIWDRNLEIHYNQKVIKPKNKDSVKIELQGKIKCPILNANVSSIVCSKLMDHNDWPRGLDPDICTECNCFVSLSIKKFQGKKKKE